MDREDLKIIAVFCTICLAAVTLYGATAVLLITKELPSEGVTGVADLTIYELDGSTLQTKLNWGVVKNGTYTKRSIIENTGNVPLSLSMAYSTHSWLSLSWNCTDHVLQPEQQVTAEWTLTLTNAPTNTPFSFDIEITGEET